MSHNTEEQLCSEQNIERGCECIGTCHIHSTQGYDAKTAPVFKLVERNGKQIKVCSRCDLPSDKLIKYLVTKKHPFMPYFDYDSLIIGRVEEFPE